jgi:alkane 1-monooxygenase
MDSIANSTVPKGSTEQWRDPKRYLWLIGLVVPSLFFIGYGGWLATGWPGLFWIGPVVILVIVPAIDLVAGLDRSNPPDDVIEALEQDRYYRWITYLFLPIQYVGFVSAMYLIARGDPLGVGGELPLWAKVGLAVSIGCIGGIGINTAHELGHKKESHERWLSKIALAQSFYGHFYIEHNRGHHVRVATPKDPASARVGESFYQFWPRTVVGSLKSAWRLEKRRYARKKQHPFRLGNDVLNAWLMSLVLWGALVAWLGVGILPYLVVQAVVGFSLLEVVNYMEHYGMLRQKVGVGERQRYERVDPTHSWNSNNIATNVLLYHLQRHSDHHANPTRRYQSLRDFEQSPVLPTGYAGMIVLSIVPAVWRRVMDPRVLAHFDGDLSRANLSPRKRERILAAYPPIPVVEEVALQPSRAPSEAVVADEVLAARCPGCGYTYDVVTGDEREGFAAGTAWADVPDTWCCPDCGVREKVDFVPLDRSLAAGT